MMVALKESTRWEKRFGKAQHFSMRKWPVELAETVPVFAIWAVNCVLGAAYLVLWACAQWGVDRLVDGFQLSGIDYWTLLAIQLLFAVATLVPILIHICVSTMRTVVEGWIAMREELNKIGIP